MDVSDLGKAIAKLGNSNASKVEAPVAEEKKDYGPGFQVYIDPDLLVSVLAGEIAETTPVGSARVDNTLFTGFVGFDKETKQARSRTTLRGTRFAIRFKPSKSKDELMTRALARETGLSEDIVKYFLSLTGAQRRALIESFQ